MIERALELAMKRAQGAEVTLREERTSNAEYENDLLKRVGATQTSHLAVRVIVNGKVGQAFTTDREQVESVVQRALELAEFGSEAKFEFPGPPESVPEVKTYDPEVERTTREELVATGGEMRDILKGYNSEVKVSGGAGWAAGRRRLVNSSGLDITTEGTHYGAGIEGMWVRGTDMLFAGYGRDWRRKEVDPKALAGKTIDDLRNGENIATVATGELPVIFTPRGVRVLTLPIVLGVNGKNVLKGDSPLAGKLGQRICGEQVTLLDDPILDYAPASGSYDGEGIPRRVNPLLEKGVLRTFLYDLETAGKAGAESTGSGPGGGTSNLMLEPGEASFEEMLRSTQEGLIVESVLGLGQGNIINGDFSVNIALGFKVEHGEIVGRVKNTMLAGNAYDALNRIEAIGSHREWSGSSCMPYVKIRALSVTAKE